MGPQPPSGMPLLQRGPLHRLPVDLCFPVAPRYQNGATQSQHRGETWDVNAGRWKDGRNLAGGDLAANRPGFLYFKGSTGHGTQQANHFCCHLVPQQIPLPPGILNQNLLLPSEDISHHILPCHCPGLPSRQPYSFVTHSDSSLPALSLSNLCLWGRPNAGGRRVRHGDPDVHCRILLWIPHREQFSVPASPGCLCHLQPCPASWLGSTGTAQAKPML